jgi:hypothetical protein
MVGLDLPGTHYSAFPDLVDPWWSLFAEGGWLTSKERDRIDGSLAKVTGSATLGGLIAGAAFPKGLVAPTGFGRRTCFRLCHLMVSRS